MTMQTQSDDELELLIELLSNIKVSDGIKKKEQVENKVLVEEIDFDEDPIIKELIEEKNTEPNIKNSLVAYIKRIFSSKEIVFIRLGIFDESDDGEIVFREGQ